MEHRPQDGRVEHPIGNRAGEARVARPNQPERVANGMAEQLRADSQARVALAASVSAVGIHVGRNPGPRCEHET